MIFFCKLIHFLDQFSLFSNKDCIQNRDHVDIIVVTAKLYIDSHSIKSVASRYAELICYKKLLYLVDWTVPDDHECKKPIEHITQMHPHSKFPISGRLLHFFYPENLTQTLALLILNNKQKKQLNRSSRSQVMRLPTNSIQFLII